MKKRTLPTGGFTLIEIMIVVAIIALLATVAIPSLVKARSTAQAQSCIGNLQTIEGAKNTWALEKNQGGGVSPSDTDLMPYIKLNSAGKIPGCPASGTYTYGTVDEHPVCSLSSASPPHKVP
jgi:prepilin-type N-terminal cleavage/methylation domain-containing protein